MSKESGLGWTTFDVDNHNGVPKGLRNDITNFEFATPRAIQEVTGVDKSAMERLLLLADFSITMNGVFNDTGDFSHDTLKRVTSSSTIRTIRMVVSGQMLQAECALTDYVLNRADDGSLTWTCPAVLQDGTVPTWA